jgi:hypothetical protein
MTESKPAEGADKSEAPKTAAKTGTVIPVQAAPTVSRVVHYQEGENPPLAAIVTAVRGKKVSLVIFREHLQMFRQDVPFSEKPKNGCWNWPPRA